MLLIKTTAILFIYFLYKIYPLDGCLKQAYYFSWSMGGPNYVKQMQRTGEIAFANAGGDHNDRHHGDKGLGLLAKIALLPIHWTGIAPG